MTTEAPLIRDGAQTVAAVNYNQPVVALLGPNGSGQYLCVNISASRTVALQTAQGGAVYGILQNTPDIGQVADVCIFGITKAVTQTTVAAGAELMSFTDGRVLTWAAGSGFRKIGMAIEAATAANQQIAILFYGGGSSVLT